VDHFLSGDWITFRAARPHKRVKRVTLCGNWSSDLLVVALAIFLTLLLRIPSLARTAADSH
jgi:hypothetical protein